MTTMAMKISLKFTLLQTLSHLFQLVQFFKCWKSFLELNSKRLYQSSGKEKESQCLVFTSSTKREIRHMLHYVIVMQQRQMRVSSNAIQVQEMYKKGDARAQLLFCLLNLLGQIFT